MSEAKSNSQEKDETARWIGPDEVSKLPPGTFLLADIGGKEESAIVQKALTGYDKYSTIDLQTLGGLVHCPFSHAYHPVAGTKFMGARFRVLRRPAAARWIGFAGVAAKSYSMTSGTDPEFFVRKGDGELLPAFEFLSYGSNQLQSSVYWDGFQAEFTVQPDTCLDRLNSKIRGQIQTLIQTARLKDRNAVLSAESVVEVPELMRLRAKDEHVVLGCSPSFNAYGSEGIKVADGRQLPIRFAGGHMHFGLVQKSSGYINSSELPTGAKDKDREVADEIAKTLDATVGLMGVSMAAGYDDSRRRQYYGLAGEYRLPKHGLEYRTLSNFVFTHPALVYFFYDMARQAVSLGFQDYRRKILPDEDNVQSAINNNDVKLARKLLLQSEPVWMKLLANKSYAMYAKQSFAAIMEGPGLVKINPAAIETNWQQVRNWCTTVGGR